MGLTLLRVLAKIAYCLCQDITVLKNVIKDSLNKKMPQKAAEQIRKLIDKAGKVLITTRRQPTGDGLASALALLLILKKLNNNAEIIIDSFNLPRDYSFLPSVNEIKSAVKKLKKFIINLDISQTGIEDLNYDIQGDNLRIHLSPARGVFTPEDLKFQTGEFAYDLVFVLDAPDLEALGNLYDHHRDIFYQIPVINIDHQAANTQYGHMNIIDITACSVSEIIFRLAGFWQEDIFDKDIATCLLTGIISKTKSFKTNNVSPEALSMASQLIEYGANRKEIVTNLFQTKTISTLKLWGKILSRLQSDPKQKLVWSKLDIHDFTESGSSEKDVAGVINELITNHPLAEIIILFYQTEAGKTKAIIHTESTINALSLVRQFNAVGDNDDASFILEANLDEAEKIVLESIKPN